MQPLAAMILAFNDAALGSYDPRVRCCYGVVIKPSAGLAKCHAGSTSSVDPKV
jgi:hypothetical protein